MQFVALKNLEKGLCTNLVLHDLNRILYYFFSFFLHFLVMKYKNNSLTTYNIFGKCFKNFLSNMLL